MEKMGVNSPTTDPQKLNARINRENLKCARCKEPLAAGVPVHVQVEPGTLESLRLAGFPFPHDN